VGAVFGSFAALCIGVSDLFGRRVVNGAHALTAAAVMQFVAIFTSAATLGLVDSELRGGDLLLGAFSGLGLGTGLACYYRGLTRSTSTVVAPLVATLSALIPFTYAAITGSTPTAVALAGAGIAFVGLAVITIGGRRAEHVKSGLLWGLASGIGYGFGLTVIIEASEASGSWPAVTQRIAAFALLTAVASALTVPIVPPPSYRVPAVLAGVFAGFSTVSYLLGVQADAPVAVVTASMFPAFSVAIGWLVFHDSVSRLQVGGIAAVLIGVAGVVAG